MKFTTNTTIECPPQELWAWLTEVPRMKLWMKGLVDVTPTSPPPRRAGSTAVLKLEQGRRIREYPATTLVFDAPRHLRMSMFGGCVVDYRLDDLGPRTRLDCDCEIELPGAAKLLSPLLAIMGRMQLNGFLKKLKRLAEAGADVATAS